MLALNSRLWLPSTLQIMVAIDIAMGIHALSHQVTHVGRFSPIWEFHYVDASFEYCVVICGPQSPVHLKPFDSCRSEFKIYWQIHLSTHIRCQSLLVSRHLFIHWYPQTQFDCHLGRVDRQWFLHLIASFLE